MRSAWVACLVCASAPTFADPAPPATAVKETASRQIAFGANAPFRWGDSIGISAYVPVHGKHVIRGNVASYAYSDASVDVLTGGNDEADRDGQITDIGIAWMYFPRARWSGFFVEAGLLGRDKDTELRDMDVLETTQTRTYAVRGLIGWSWLAYDHVFLAMSLGLSAGREIGTESFEDEIFQSRREADVDRRVVSGEAFLRIGFVLDAGP